MRPNTRANRSWIADAPALEPLESRLLLAADPTFATALSDYYVLADDTPLTIGIDGFDADAADSLSITVAIAGADPGVTAQTYDYNSGNRYALLHFADAAGDPVGDILVQLFETRGPEATGQFITLATNYFDDDGNPLPADIDNPAFYTDVIVHRIIPEFMVQTGDAELGDGTGGSPLDDFVGDFDPSLSFAGRGVLAMANAGPGTNNSQFFITDVPTPHLNGNHPIFGQVITGWDVYQSLINLPTDGSDRPNDPPVLSSVEIINSDQDGSITLIADDDFLGETEVTITLTDDLGNQVSQIITLVPADDVDHQPSIGSIADVTLLPDDPRQVEFSLSYDGADPLDVTAWSNYDGDGNVGLTVTPGAGVDPYTLDITLPAEYDGREFTIAVGATLAGYDNLKPSVRRFDLSLGDRPTIDDPGATRVSPGGDTTVPLLIEDPDTTDFSVTAEADNVDVVVAVDPDTYELTITAPADLSGTFEITVTAVEAGFAEFADLPGATQAFTAVAVGDAPVIGMADPIVYGIAGDTITFDAGITDDSGVELTVELTSRINSATSRYVRVDPVEDEDTGEIIRYDVTVDLTGLPPNFSSSIEVVLTAVEADYADLLDATTNTFHVISRNPYDPTILDYLVPDDETKITAVAGDRLYVGTSAALEIYDRTDPTQPALLGSYATSREVTDIIVAGNTAYVSILGAVYGSWVYESGKVLSLDVTDPEDIVLLDSVETNDLAQDIDIEGDRLYLANGAAGVLILDISDPESITTLATYTGSGRSTLVAATGVVAHNSIVYVADGAGNVVVLNAMNTQDVRKVTSLNTKVWSYKGQPAAVAVQDNMLYVVDNATGLFVYSLAAPTAPKKVGWLGWPSSDLTVNDGLAVISLGGFHRYVDVSDPKAMVVLHSRFSPGWVGTCSFDDNGIIYAPNGAEGMMIMDTTPVTDTLGIAKTRKIVDDQGVAVTIKITGGGTVRAHVDEATGAILSLDIVDTTVKTTVKITTPRGRTTTIGDINIYGTIKSLSATTTTLTGNLILEGGAASIALGDVGGPARVEQLIRIDGPEVLTVKDAIAIKLGSVNDLRIDSAMPIKSLTAVEWFDDESDLAGDWLDGEYDEEDGITAPALDKLLIKGPRGGPAGHFQADLTLNEDGTAPKPTVLGPTTIGGHLSEATWTVYGQAAAIKRGSDDGSWVLNIDQSLRPTTVYNKRTFTLDSGAVVTFGITGGGTLRFTPDDTGASDIATLAINDPTPKTRVTVTSSSGTVTIADITAGGTLAAISAPGVTLTGDLTVVEGDLTTLVLGDVAGAAEQTITIEGSGVLNPNTAVSISLGDVTDLSIDSAIVIKSLIAASWTDTAASDADGIVAPAIDKLVVNGNFQADLTLNEDGYAPKAVVLGSANIIAMVSGATWNIYGAAGPIIGTDGGGWTRNVDESFRPTTIYTSRTFTLSGGRTLTLSIVGGGTMRVIPDDSGDADVASITIVNPTLKTRVTAKTTGGAVAVAEITSVGSLSGIAAGDITLTGDLTIVGIINSLVLGDVGGATRAEQVIRISGTSSSAKRAAAITLGRVQDLRIHSDLPLRSLTAVEWLDDETEWAAGGDEWTESEYTEVDAVIAPSLDKLFIKPPSGQAGGDFRADLDLNSDFTATKTTVLGSANIDGEISESIWLIGNGNTGALMAATTTDSWDLDVDGAVKSVDTKGDMAGTLSANWFGKITAKGVLAADITALDSAKGNSIGLLKADAVDGTDLDVIDGVKTLQAGQWIGGSIIADRLGNVTIKPGKGSSTSGDFTPDSMTVTGATGAINIAGDAAGEWAATAFKSVAIGGDADYLNLYADRWADARGRVLALGKLTVTGRLSNSRILAAGNVGAVTVGAMENTDLYGGYVAASLDTVIGLPTPAEMNSVILFDALATIKSVTVKGLKDVAGLPVDSFIASNIAAPKLGSVKLVYAALDAGAAPFGAIGNSLKTYRYQDNTNLVTWSSRKPGPTGEPDAVDNLVIRLV